MAVPLFGLVEGRSESKPRWNAGRSGRGIVDAAQHLLQSKTDARETANTTVRDSMGLFYDVPKTGDLINRIIAGASERLIESAPALVA
jgi:hypothetical protein